MNEFSSEMEETLAGGVFFLKNGGMGNVRPARSSRFFCLSRVKFGPGKATCLQFQGGCESCSAQECRGGNPTQKIPSFVLLLAACMFWTPGILEFE